MSTFKTLILCILFVMVCAMLGQYLDKPQPKGTVEVFLDPPEPQMVHLEKMNEFLSLSPSDKHCLALNVYHEAKHEPYIGKIAVAQVTHKRVEKQLRGKSFCEVVFSPHQFSWTDIPSLRNEQPSGSSWVQAKHAVEMYTRGVRTNLFTADHYHADYINSPNWTKRMKLDGQVSRHIFYTSAE